jgi:hypothetical protein
MTTATMVIRHLWVVAMFSLLQMWKVEVRLFCCSCLAIDMIWTGSQEFSGSEASDKEAVVQNVPKILNGAHEFYGAL